MLRRCLALRTPVHQAGSAKRLFSAPGREALRRELDVRPSSASSSYNAGLGGQQNPLRGSSPHGGNAQTGRQKPENPSRNRPKGQVETRDSNAGPRTLGRLDLTKSVAQRPVMDLTSMAFASKQKPSVSSPTSMPAPQNDRTSEPSKTSKQMKNVQEPVSQPVSTVMLPDGSDVISVRALAELSNIAVEKLVGHVVQLGAADENLLPPRVLEQVRGGRLTSRHAMSRAAASIELPLDTAELILLECGVQVKYASANEDKQDRVRQQPTVNTPRRAPIVVVMGHVDHGKTTLLDALRNTNVAAKEEGGITQSIAAFRVDLPNGHSACFLDTPGHEAFSSMRKSGTQVTDVACIVIAATDGVMPQTVESVTFAREAKLPIVFAITKCDMAKARASGSFSDGDIEASITDQLNVFGLFDAENDMLVRVVAPQRQGLDELVESIRMQVEINEQSLLARSEPNDPGEAVVLESKIDRALGPVADVVVRWGTLKVGDYVVCDDKWAKIRRLVLNDGKSVSECPPATPARLSGFESSLTPGSDILVVPQGERECRRIVEVRERRIQRQAEREAKRKAIRQVLSGGKANAAGTADDTRIGRKSLGEKKIQRRLQQEKMEETFSEIEERHERSIRVILRADAQGSLNALLFAMRQMKEKGEVPEDRELVIVKNAVGTFTEQDLELAHTTESYLLGFNIKFPGSLQKKAKSLKIVGIHTHGVIYNLLEEFAMTVQEQLEKQQESSGENADGTVTPKVKGVAQVLGVFDLKGKDKKQVAGVRIMEGLINKNDLYIVKRNGEIVAELKSIDSLRVLKKDVAIVEKGSECGIALQDFVGYQVGDIIEAVEPPPR